MSEQFSANSWNPLQINPCVRSEFGTLKMAIISPLSNPDAYGTPRDETNNSFRRLRTREIVTNSDIRAHSQLPEILEKNGVTLCYPHHPNLPLSDANFKKWVGGDIYCHDFLGVIDETVISSRVAHFRNIFRMYYDSIVRALPQHQLKQTDERFTWGDGLLVGENLLVGLEHNDFFTDIKNQVPEEAFQAALDSYAERSNGIRAITTILQQVASTRSVLTLATNANSDLDISLAPLPRRNAGEPRRAIIRTEAFHPASEEALYSVFDELIPYQDPWHTMGCNILWLDPETPLIPLEARYTGAYLQSLGFNVQKKPLGTLLQNDNTGTGAHGEPGGWRCLTGVLERADDYPFN